jgi:hypothetical protein
MEDWLLMQGFYHGLTKKAHEQLNTTARGSFMSLSLRKAEALMEKITSNQGWSPGNIQYCKKSKEANEEVCALSTKMDVLLNWLEQRVLTVVSVHFKLLIKHEIGHISTSNIELGLN